MNFKKLTLIGFIFIAPMTFARSFSGTNEGVYPVSLDLWTNKGDGSIYHSGEDIQIYFRTNENCFVTVYNIDTDGRTHILFPLYPDEGFVYGNRTYRLPDYYDNYDLRVSSHRGVEYLHAIATKEPNAFTYRPLQNRYFLRTEFVSSDPFLAINEINSTLLSPSYIHATATTSFFIESFVWYPRYICSSCHSHSNVNFDPYESTCPHYQVITVHNYDYWWDFDYYPRRINSTYAGPFWRCIVRTHQPAFYQPHHTWFQIAFGCNNFFTSISFTRPYTPRYRPDVRYRTFAQYENEYRPSETRYRARTSGSTRRLNNSNQSDNITSRERTINENKQSRVNDNQMSDRSNRDRSISTRSEERINLNNTRDRIPESNDKISPDRSRRIEQWNGSEDRRNQSDRTVQSDIPRIEVDKNRARTQSRERQDQPNVNPERDRNSKSAGRTRNSEQQISTRDNSSRRR